MGLQLVKEDLYARGIPIAYLQLDDWWYTGKFFFGNVKSVTDWHASNVSRLFPSGLNAFSTKLDLPLQLYTPFFADDFVTPYNMTESTAFKGTKIVTPADSYKFFADLFDLGLAQTGGRMKAYEVDFLLSNFAGSASMFESVTSASEWYSGMADAGLERGIVIQYCLCSATDILESLTLPAVVQARASGDYVNKVSARMWARAAERVPRWAASLSFHPPTPPPHTSHRRSQTRSRWAAAACSWARSRLRRQRTRYGRRRRSQAPCRTRSTTV